MSLGANFEANAGKKCEYQRSAGDSGTHIALYYWFSFIFEKTKTISHRENRIIKIAFREITEL